MLGPEARARDTRTIKKVRFLDLSLKQVSGETSGPTTPGINAGFRCPLPTDKYCGNSDPVLFSVLKRNEGIIQLHFQGIFIVDLTLSSSQIY